MRATQVRTAELKLASWLKCDTLAIKLGTDDEVLFEDGLPAKPGWRDEAPPREPYAAVRRGAGPHVSARAC